MLHVHRADRADGLVEALGELLADPLADPMATEIVSVPTRGVERWLAQMLSTRLGVCANVDFPPPGRVVADAVAAACGVDPDVDPWRPERSAWALLDVVEQHLDEPWLERLRTYLGDEHDEVRRARRLSAVRHLAELYDRYALLRPELVRGWAAGEDTHWQAELWRRLRACIDLPGPAERLEAATAALTAEPGRAALPARLSLFGLTRLHAGHLRVLEALAGARDVHLFLLHPSPVLWRKLSDATPPPTRAQDPTKLTAANPLLASWGRDSRELQLVLAGAAHEDHHHAVAHPAGTQLAELQAAVREDRRPAPTTPDGSLQVHACHGRARQVEVLRDAILHALEDDPTLEPRDVIVMCPDIETFAPLVQATFAGLDQLRVRLADRSLRQTNPVLGVVATLLELAGARVTASEILDLADRDPVRRRFRLGDDDLARLQTWIVDSGIRWGLDKEHRAPWRVDGTDAGTWRAGLDRLLAGVTMTGDDARLIGGVLPLDDVDSMAISLAGAFAELVERLAATLEDFRRPKPAARWAEALAAAADAFALVTGRDAWQRAELQRILDDLADHGAGAAHDLGRREVRALLADRLAGRPTRANFRTGHLTVCTLVPMRSVPHRVVCLLGLDDDIFPRKAPRDGDDLTLTEPQIGERDPRAEDRQLLLDALLAAQDKLIVTYTGNDERTNAEQPPAVPIGELLDLTGRDVVVRHPLQPFDGGNFDGSRPRSFDAASLAGARALQVPRTAPPPFLAAPLGALREPVIEVTELVRFAEHPVRRFLRRRLGIELRDFTAEIADGLSVELDALEAWGVGDRLLALRLDGVDARAARQAELRGGLLPPGALGEPLVTAAEPKVEALLAEAGAGASRSVDVRVELPDGRVISGTVPGVCGTTLRTVTYSTLAAKHRLSAWVRLLALTADDPGAGYDARTIARSANRAAVRTLAPLDGAVAIAHLAALADLYERGTQAPIALACKTSAAYAERGHDAARDEWTSGYTRWGWRDREDAEPEHVRAFGAKLTYDELAALPGYEDDAHALWDPLLAHEAAG